MTAQIINDSTTKNLFISLSCFVRYNSVAYNTFSDTLINTSANRLADRSCYTVLGREVARPVKACKLVVGAEAVGAVVEVAVVEVEGVEGVVGPVQALLLPVLLAYSKALSRRCSMSGSCPASSILDHNLRCKKSSSLAGIAFCCK